MLLIQLIVLDKSTYLRVAPFPLADANGNCVSFIDEAGNVQAHYTYDAFGNIISQTGAKDDDFRFRFSSKYLDGETGLLYYGFRYYAPALGRWVNRDPIEERGGLLLYGFVGNNGVYDIDYFGLREKRIEIFEFVPINEFTYPLDDEGNPIISTKEDRKRVREVNRKNSMEPELKHFVDKFDQMLGLLEGISDCDDCVDQLIISAHASGPGRVEFGGISYAQEYYKYRDYDEDKLSKRNKEGRDKLNNAASKIAEMGQHLCKNAKVTFLICGSGRGEQGQALRDQLKQLLPEGTIVVTYTGECGFLFGKPFPKPFTNSKKQR